MNETLRERMLHIRRMRFEFSIVAKKVCNPKNATARSKRQLAPTIVFIKILITK
jgi:hypothetical protein